MRPLGRWIRRALGRLGLALLVLGILFPFHIHRFEPGAQPGDHEDCVCPGPGRRDSLRPVHHVDDLLCPIDHAPAPPASPALVLTTTRFQDAPRVLVLAAGSPLPRRPTARGPPAA